MKYVGTRDIEWSKKGRGNYWSDHLAFDLDGDGIADEPYQPERPGRSDRLALSRWPSLLLNSPATQILRWAQSAFPTLLSGRRDRQPPSDGGARGGTAGLGRLT